MWPKTTTCLRIWPNYGASKSNVARAAGASPANAARRFPRLGDDAASQTRLLIDDVLDTLE